MKEYIKPSVEVVAFDNKSVLLVSGLSSNNSNGKFTKGKTTNSIQLS